VINGAVRRTPRWSRPRPIVYQPYQTPFKYYIIFIRRWVTVSAWVGYCYIALYIGCVWRNHALDLGGNLKFCMKIK